MLGSMPALRPGRMLALAVIALLLGTPAAANAVSPVVRVKASISPNRIHTAHGSVGTPITLRIDTAFSTQPPAGMPFTVRHADILFPPGFAANGRLFPFCSARQIARFAGVISRCPRGSRIGGGSVTAVAIQLGVTSQAKIALFNGPGGRSVTLNVQASNPANINESFDAPLARVHGKYAYKLSLPVPMSLQQILTGVYVGLKEFDVVAGATMRVHGVKRGFIEALTCPRKGTVPGHGDVDFEDYATGQQASVSVDTTAVCKRA